MMLYLDEKGGLQAKDTIPTVKYGAAGSYYGAALLHEGLVDLIKYMASSGRKIIWK